MQTVLLIENGKALGSNLKDDEDDGDLEILSDKKIKTQRKIILKEV